jgi:hypothetical protein
MYSPNKLSSLKAICNVLLYNLAMTSCSMYRCPVQVYTSKEINSSSSNYYDFYDSRHNSFLASIVTVSSMEEVSVYAESKKGSDNGYDDCHDDDDVDEHGFDATTTETELIDRRDEVNEVRKMSSKDTNRLRLWRIVVTSVILLTAFAVTFTTYTLLQQQEEENFKTAVRFSLTGCDSLLTGHRSVAASQNEFLLM